MRVAIISDVHSNRLALEAVLDDIKRQGADAIVNLGDVVAGPLEPKEAARLQMQLDCPTVRGNHDRVMTEEALERLPEADRFACAELDDEQRRWMGSLPTTFSVGKDIFMCHGVPKSDVQGWLDAAWEGRTTTLPDEAAISANAADLDYPVLVCGHTHISRAARLKDDRLIVNPGSVGLQVFHGVPDARYALVERSNGRWSATFRLVPYDHLAAARQAVANGFPRWSEAVTSGWAGFAGLFA
jgi:predicted phosphodiesterase